MYSSVDLDEHVDDSRLLEPFELHEYEGTWILLFGGEQFVGWVVIETCYFDSAIAVLSVSRPSW